MKFRTYSVTLLQPNRDEKIVTLIARNRAELRNLISVEYPAHTVIKIHLEKEVIIKKDLEDNYFKI
jgi:hypothetical protein